MSPASRLARPQDVPALAAFIFEHGANPWNYLPQEAVLGHLHGIVEGSVQAVVAEQAGELVGFVTYLHSSNCRDYQPAQRRDLPQGYIGEAVVHRDLTGQGFGARLLGEAVSRLVEQGVRDIYIERHEENSASAGMMRKAGFVEVCTFSDPERRANGSRRTTLCYLQVE